MEKFIEEQYNKIVSKMIGGKLYNMPIDIDNHKQLVVAAYSMGRRDELQNKQPYMEFREEFDNPNIYLKKNLWWKIKSYLKRVILYKIHLYE